MTFGTGTLRRGSTGEGVTELQQWLIDRRFLIAYGAPSGTFDETTEHAVKAFQFSAGIGVDGVVGDGSRTAAEAFSGTASSTGWHTSATRNVQVDQSGGTYTTDTRRGVLHTTETSRLPSYSSPPHFTIGRDGAGQPVSIWQHFPITIASKALRHPSGTVQTNRHGAIQIEIITFAENSASLQTDDADLFTSLGLLMRWIESNAGVEWASHYTFDGDQAYGESGTVRLSDADWLASSGWLGHQHVPHNSHWDPGRIDINGLLNVFSPSALSASASTRRTSGLSAVNAGRPSIRATTRRLTNAFPSLTFAVDPGGHPFFEILLTTDMALFAPEMASSRNSTNFYASRQDGLKESSVAQGRYVAPVPVVSEFASANPMGGTVYYSIVVYANADGANPMPAAEPRALASSAPSVAMARGFVGHTATESSGVPLSMLRRSGRPVARRHTTHAGLLEVDSPRPDGGGPGNGGGDTSGGANRLGDDREIDASADSAEGEDGYDHRMSDGSQLPDIPADLRPASPGTNGSAANRPGANGAMPAVGPVPVRHRAARPRATVTPALRPRQTRSPSPRGSRSPTAALPNAQSPEVTPPSRMAAAGYDDGWGAWESPTALDSSFPPGQVRPAPLLGVEAPQVGTDEEYEDLGWNGKSYGTDRPGTSGTPVLPEDWRPPLPRLDPAAKRDVIEAYVGRDTDLYSAVSPDGEFNGTAGTDHPAYQHHHIGLSFGIVGFSQDSGELGQLLALMRGRDASRFEEIFGAAAAELVEVTNRPGPLSKDVEGGRSARVQPVAGSDLWEEPWLGRFVAAGRDRALKGAQIELAAGLYLDPTLRFTTDLGLATQRGLAIVFDRAAHRGVTGGMNWVIETVGPLQTNVLLNEALLAIGFPDVESFQRSQPDLLVDDQFGPLTHAAMTGALQEPPGARSGPSRPDHVLSPDAGCHDATRSRTAVGRPRREALPGRLRVR